MKAPIVRNKSIMRKKVPDTSWDGYEDDPDANAKDLHNLRNASEGSFHRYDELSAYTNRSERSMKRLDDDEVNPEVQDNTKRKVQFNDKVDVQYDKQVMSKKELSNYFMQDDDFRRVDADVQMTSLRWEKHKSGKKKMNSKEIITRGLEDVLEIDEEREVLRYRHMQEVIQETLNQRQAGRDPLDWETIRMVAASTSLASTKRSIELGNRDAKEAKEVAAEKSKSTRAGLKKSRSLFNLFRKKKR